jgi:predicted RNA-binding protein with PUA-like domain
MRSRYWFVKSEPEVFSFDDLLAAPEGITSWDGVRNYQARNFMRKMKVGDEVLFHHSSSKPPAVVGVAEVVKESYPDETQFDPESLYYDAKATPDKPRWLALDVRAGRKLTRPVTLQEIKNEPSLRDSRLVQRGNRLSVMPLTEEEFRRILEMAHLLS